MKFAIVFVIDVRADEAMLQGRKRGVLGGGTGPAKEEWGRSTSVPSPYLYFILHW